VEYELPPDDGLYHSGHPECLMDVKDCIRENNDIEVLGRD